MSDINKTIEQRIERVKKYHKQCQGDEPEASNALDNFYFEATNSIMPIIAELEKMTDIRNELDKMLYEANQTIISRSAELETAQKRIAGLGKEKERLQKSNDIVFGQMTEESDRADKAEQINAELLEALKPLAEMYDKVGENDYVLTNNPDRHYEKWNEGDWCVWDLGIALYKINEAYDKHKGELNE